MCCSTTSVTTGKVAIVSGAASEGTPRRGPPADGVLADHAVAGRGAPGERDTSATASMRKQELDMAVMYVDAFEPGVSPRAVP